MILHRRMRDAGMLAAVAAHGVLETVFPARYRADLEAARAAEDALNDFEAERECVVGRDEVL